MAESANRIESKGPVQIVEHIAGEAGIYPGMLIKLNTSDQVIKHDVEGGELGDENMFALEDAKQGRGIATVYASGDLVSCVVPNQGSEVRMLIEDGQNVAISNKIISAGNGKLKVSSDLESGETLAHVNGVATEANDLTGSNSSDTISRIRIV